MSEACTLCLSCVSASCPTGALSDNPDRPMLRFTEDACVQCGLCEKTCPENVITLKPQIDFRAVTASPRILKEGAAILLHQLRQAVWRQEHHRARGGETRRQALDVQRQQAPQTSSRCATIAGVGFVSEEGFDPYGTPRPLARTTDDYLREREERKDREGQRLERDRLRRSLLRRTGGWLPGRHSGALFRKLILKPNVVMLFRPIEIDFTFPHRFESAFDPKRTNIDMG